MLDCISKYDAADYLSTVRRSVADINVTGGGRHRTNKQEVLETEKQANINAACKGEY